jgi:hypothetical protein
MNDETRFLALATGLTLLVGLLAGVVSQLTAYSLPLFPGMSYLLPGPSDPAAVLALRAVDATLLVVPLLYLAVPAVVVLGCPPGERWRYVAAAGVSVFGLPLVGLLGQVVFGLAVRETLVVLGVLALLLGGFVGLSHLGDRVSGTLPAHAASLGPVFAVVLLVGTFAGGYAGARVSDGLASQYGAYPPQAAFAYDYDPAGDGRAVLEIRHEGGPAIPAEELSVESDTIVPVEGANQTESGPWQGSTTAGEDGRVVDVGDAVAVGITEDCEAVRVVWRGEAAAATIALYECPGAR